ncbi:MAG: hypothetical protein RQ741_10740 [Wenzhouxiangellaceae bacterium]|nr:hypothetical protein [Wenzhouxiangellaceae bacterium]
MNDLLNRSENPGFLQHAEDVGEWAVLLFDVGQIVIGGSSSGVAGSAAGFCVFWGMRFLPSMMARPDPSTSSRSLPLTSAVEQ